MATESTILIMILLPSKIIMNNKNFKLMEYLVKLRGELTQEELAQRAGINKSTYAKLEQGTRNITPETACKLGIFHGVSPYEFLKFIPKWKNLLDQVGNIDFNQK